VSISVIAPAADTARDIARPAHRYTSIAAAPQLPLIAPGQLWLVEAADGIELSAAAQRVFDGINVVIYDRALADVVADRLPLGGYAEPAPARGDVAASRAVGFARDGWSVVRLLPARLAPRDRTRRVQDIVDELAAAKIAGRLPVMVFAEGADGIEESITARFDDLASIVASYPRDTRLTIVIEAFAGAAASARHAVVANGLAG
jgi:hypothetical protein